MGSATAEAETESPPRQSVEAEKNYHVPKPGYEEKTYCRLYEKKALEFAEELAKKDTEIQKLNDKVKKESQAVKDKDAALKKAQALTSKKDSEITGLTKRLNEEKMKNSSVMQLDAQISKLKSDNDALSNLNKTYETRVTVLEAEKEKLRHEKNALDAIVENLKMENESLQKTIGNKDFELDAVNNSLNNLRSDLDTANQEKDACQSDLRTSAQGLSTCKTNLNDTESKLTKANATIDQHKSRANILYVVAGVLVAVIIGFGVWILLLNKDKLFKKKGDTVNETSNDSMDETVYNPDDDATADTYNDNSYEPVEEAYTEPSNEVNDEPVEEQTNNDEYEPINEETYTEPEQSQEADENTVDDTVYDASVEY